MTVTSEPPLSRIIEEGTLIAVSAVKMAVKNRIIIGALRDHSDYSDREYTRATREELRRLIVHAHEDALRVEAGAKKLRTRRWGRGPGEDDREEAVHLDRRQSVYRGLAAELSALADGPDGKLSELLESARLAAADEIADALTARLVAGIVDPNEPDYEFRRDERLEQLALDLVMLRPTAQSRSAPRPV